MIWQNHKRRLQKRKSIKVRLDFFKFIKVVHEKNFLRCKLVEEGGAQRDKNILSYNSKISNTRKLQIYSQVRLLLPKNIQPLSLINICIFCLIAPHAWDTMRHQCF